VVHFPPGQATLLRPHGLLLTNVRGRHDFGHATVFEPPVVVHATIRGSVEVGAFTGFYGSRLSSTSVGRYCSIAPDVVVGLNEHPTGWMTTSLLAETPPPTTGTSSSGPAPETGNGRVASTSPPTCGAP
jgi:hypothetical protein